MGKYWAAIKLFTPAERVVLGALMIVGAAIGIWGWWCPPSWFATSPFRLNLTTAVVGFCIGLPIALTVINTVVKETQERAETLARCRPLRESLNRLRDVVDRLSRDDCMKLMRDAAADADLLRGSLDRIGEPAPFSDSQVSVLWEKYQSELRHVQLDWKDELGRFVRAADRVGKNASAQSAWGEGLAEDIGKAVDAIDLMQDSLMCTIWIEGPYTVRHKTGSDPHDYGEYDEDGLHGDLTRTLDLFGVTPSDRKRADEASGRIWSCVEDENTEKNIEDALRGLGGAAAELNNAVEAIDRGVKGFPGSVDWKQIP